MLLTSRFSAKGLISDLILLVLSVIALTTVSAISKQALMSTIVVMSVVLVIVLAIWLFRLKVITITDHELEVRHACIPFLKHFYRLTEFDSYILDQRGKTECLYLLSQGRRVVVLSSSFYENYEELKQALSTVGSGEWGTDAARAVDSVFAKGHLIGVFFLLFFVLVAAAIPVCEYFEDKQITMRSFLLSVFCGLPFLCFFLYALYGCKRLTIWRGHLEVRRLLCPSRVRYYALDDIDMTLEIITKSQYSEEESLWLVSNRKLAVSISRSVYANYDALKYAIGIVPSDTIEMSSFKKIHYYLGKSFDI